MSSPAPAAPTPASGASAPATPAPATSRRPAANEVDVELETLIRARYPIIYVVSWEERRVEESLREICQRRGKKMFQWTLTTGMAGDAASKDPLAALNYVLNAADQSVFVLKDFHPFITDVAVTRRLRDLVYALKTSYKTLVILSPLLKLPPELEKEISVVDYQLPTLNDLDRLLEGIIQSVRSNPQIKTEMTPLEREHILKAAMGLTSNEAENVFAKSLVEKRSFDVDVILGEKEQIIRKSGILEYYRLSDAFAEVGGLDLLKQWMQARTVSFTEDARRYGLPEPKGILLLGVQGCGKSLSAKAVASLWRLPLLRLDVGKIFAGIVGSSEENMRKAIATAESVAPCILWLDELEKGFAGTQSSGFSDGGTTSRVFSTFLTWLQEKEAPCFVVATSNDVSLLPPELMRKGRFDEIFFVDLPSVEERREIFAIHLKKRGRDPKNYDLDLLAARTVGYSGAEIEQVVVSSLYDSFNDNQRELRTDDLLRTIGHQVPLSVTMREGIAQLRDWAETRARQASSQQSEPTEELVAPDFSGPDHPRLPAAAPAAAPFAHGGDGDGAVGSHDDDEEAALRARVEALEQKTATGMEPLLHSAMNAGALAPSLPAVEAEGTGAPLTPPSPAAPAPIAGSAAVQNDGSDDDAATIPSGDVEVSGS